MLDISLLEKPRCSPLEILFNVSVAVDSRSHPVKDPALATYGSWGNPIAGGAPPGGTGIGGIAGAMFLCFVLVSQQLRRTSKLSSPSAQLPAWVSSWICVLRFPRISCRGIGGLLSFLIPHSSIMFQVLLLHVDGARIFLLTGFVVVSHFCSDTIFKKVDWAQK